jgi:hypothetical protein
MATFLTANMGELPDHRDLQDAMAFAQRGVFTVNPHFAQGLAWQIVDRGDLVIIEMAACRTRQRISALRLRPRPGL